MIFGEYNAYAFNIAQHERIVTIVSLLRGMKQDICDNAGSINIELEVYAVSRKIRTI